MFQGLRRLGGLTLAIVLVVATPSAQLRRAEAGAGGVTENFEVVGHLSFPGPTPEGDIALFDYGGDVGNHAFIGAWREPCTGKPVRIVDVSDPTQPRVVGRADSGEGTSSEDVVVRRIGDRVVLATGIQACFHHGRHGLALFDVTDPANPRHLSFTSTPGHGVHELDVVVRPDGRALALLATPYTEFTFPGSRKTTSGEFRIVDITHPKNPVRLADWGIQRDSNLTMFDTGEPVKGSLQGLGYYPAHFGHSVRAVDDGDTAYVSYWDGGVLKFDISEPSKPLLIGRTTFPPDADGDAHSMTTYDVGGERYIFQNDEDFDPLAPAKITANVSGDVFYGLEQHPMPALLTETGEITSSFHDAKNGCDPDMRGAQDQIVIASVPPYSCLFDVMLEAAKAGARALIVSWRGPEEPRVERLPRDFRRHIRRLNGDMPVLLVAERDGLLETLRSDPTNVTLTLTPGEPSSGYLQIYRESDGADSDGDGILEYPEVGSFSDVAHVRGEWPVPSGEWSIHNTEVTGTHAYSSWYDNGVVAMDLSDPTHPARVGQFVKPSSKRSLYFGDEYGAAVWGVAIGDDGLIYASDMRSGLWIVRPTGPAAF